MPPADTRRVVRLRLAPYGAPRRRTLCLHVLSSFQRTGYQWCALAFSARPRPRPPPALFPSGEPCNLTERSLSRQLFSRGSVDFARGAFERLAPPAGNASPCPVVRALRVRLGRCELKEVSAGKCRRRVTLGPTNIRRAPETVNTGNRPNCQLIRTRVTDWLVEL